MYEYLFIFFGVFSLVAFIHELGHFIAGRFFGVKVEEFSIGWGPSVFSFGCSKGTIWKFSALPLGAYVKFAGEEVEGQSSAIVSQEEDFAKLSAFRKILVAVAGPLANFILSFSLLVAFYSLLGRPMLKISNIGEARALGFREEDLILSMNNFPVINEKQFDVQKMIGQVRVKIDRKGEEVELNLENLPENFAFTWTVEKSYNPMGLRSLVQAWLDCKFFFVFLVAGIHKLLVGEFTMKKLAGPLFIAKSSGDSWKNYGFLGLFRSTVVLSLSLCFFNLLPLPLVDGGMILFYGAEGLLGKAFSPLVYKIYVLFGYGVVGLLSVVGLKNDLERLDFFKVFSTSFWQKLFNRG